MKFIHKKNENLKKWALFGKQAFLVILLFFFFVFSLSFKFSNQVGASPDFSCQVNITSLPYAIDQNNTYYCLNQSLFVGGQTAIEFVSGTQNTTLDCLGYDLKGNDASGAYGIIVSGENNTVKNCVVTDFYSGIKLSTASNSILINNIVNYNIYYGIYISSSNNNQITNITANYNRLGCGVYILSSNNNQITNITANYNTYGFYLSSSHNNTITNSRAQKNTDYGIRLVSSGSTPNIIYNNLFNNTDNFNFAGTVYNNSWNTTKQNGIRIYSSGTEIGGNYWTDSAGNGHSDTCTDADKDGFCDSGYILDPGQTGNNTDYLPLSPDKTPPTYSLNSTNSTLAGTPVEHSLKWEDNTDLSGYIFSFWNCTNISYDWTSTNQESGVKQFRATTEEIEGFEGSFPPSGWQTGGYQDRIWFRSTKNPYAETASAESGNLYDWGTQTTWLNKNFTYRSDGNISFYWTVSSEVNYDWLCFCVDKACGDTGCTCVGSGGTADERISGNVAWTQLIKPVTEGTHTFTWCYAKDTSVTEGEDMGRVDEVKFNWTVEGWKEQNRTWQEYTSVGGNAYVNVTSVKASITVNSYDPSGSNTTYNNNIRPDIEVGIWNGSQYIVGNYCNLNNTQGNEILNTTPVNCTITKTDSDILNAWKTPSNRKIEIRGIWMDVNNSYKDEINVSAVYANIMGDIEFLNDTWVSMTGGGNWSNVTKVINSTVGCTIRWCQYANDTSNNWNGTSCQNPFSYNTTTGGLKTNGEACLEDSECISNSCKPDYDGIGKWCCDSDQCAHDGTCYDSGTSSGNYYCDSGVWRGTFEEFYRLNIRRKKFQTNFTFS